MCANSNFVWQSKAIVINLLVQFRKVEHVNMQVSLRTINNPCYSGSRNSASEFREWSPHPRFPDSRCQSSFVSFLVSICSVFDNLKKYAVHWGDNSGSWFLLHRWLDLNSHNSGLKHHGGVYLQSQHLGGEGRWIAPQESTFKELQASELLCFQPKPMQGGFYLRNDNRS